MVAESRIKTSICLNQLHPPLNHASRLMSPCRETNQNLDDVSRSPPSAAGAYNWGYPWHKRHPHGPLLERCVRCCGGPLSAVPRSPNVQRELRPTSCTDGSLDRLVSSFVLVNHEQRKGTLGGTEDTDSRGTPSWVCIYRSNCLLTFVVCRSFLLFTVPRCVYLHLRRHTTKSSRSCQNTSKYPTTSPSTYKKTQTRESRETYY